MPVVIRSRLTRRWLPTGGSLSENLSLLVAVALALKKKEPSRICVSKGTLNTRCKRRPAPSPTTGHTACRNLNNLPLKSKIWYGGPALPCNFVYSALGSAVPAC
jgi:hypothetical protein